MPARATCRDQDGFNLCLIIAHQSRDQYPNHVHALYMYLHARSAHALCVRPAGERSAYVRIPSRFGAKVVLGHK